MQQRSKFKPKDQILERLAIVLLFQLHALQKVNKTQLIYHGVEACTKLKRPWAKAVIHALLQKSMRTPPNWQDPDSYGHCVPMWLWNQLSPQQQQSPDYIPTWMHEQRYSAVRVNPGQTREHYSTKLQQQGVPFWLSAHCKQAIHLAKKHIPVLPGLSSQEVYIQDITNQLIVQHLPKLAPHSTVLDACAAPGGKTGALLSQQQHIRVVAIDSAAHKTTQLQHNLQPFAAQVEVRCMDAILAPDRWQQKSFAAILLDPPCTASGTICSHPELKRRHDEQSLNELTQRQALLLAQLWPLVQDQGWLLYSTCSVLSCENEQIIQQHCERNSDAYLHDINSSHPSEKMKTFPPSAYAHGGFVALLQKHSKTCG